MGEVGEPGGLGELVAGARGLVGSRRRRLKVSGTFDGAPSTDDLRELSLARVLLGRSRSPRSQALSVFLGSDPPGAPRSLTTWQATTLPSPSGRSSGRSTRHRGSASGHRGWNAQPDGGAS